MRTTNPADDIAAAIRVNKMAQDGSWNESDHPRAENGQFGSGSGGGSSTPAKAAGGEGEKKHETREFKKGPFGRVGPEEAAYNTEHFQKHGVLPPKHMNEKARSKESKAMGRFKDMAHQQAAGATNEIAKAAFTKAAGHFETAAKAYGEGNNEVGSREEKLGMYAQRHGELNSR